jgi:NAD(P)-dependent dehydrogenase (short-subunit alcohol dehydrogenase family)
MALKTPPRNSMMSSTRRARLVSGGIVLSALMPGSRKSILAADATQSGPLATGSLKGKTALVTGSTDGLGHAVALQLGAAGARVIVHGRNRERGEAVVAELKQAGSDSAFLAADFASLAEVRKLAATVKAAYPQLDLLINNAGIGSQNRDGSRGRELSTDGYELRFAVNYLSGYLLTQLLLPTLRGPTPTRIVNVASIGQRAIDFDNVMLEREYDGSRAYAQSKLAQIMYTMDLAHELDSAKITANCLHPATYMDTAMVRDAGVQPRSTVAEGAAAVVYVATSPTLAGKSGLFFNGQREARANAQAYDDSARAKLTDA